MVNRWFCGVFGLILAAALNCAWANAPDLEAVLFTSMADSNGVPLDEPQQEFDCNDQIHAVATVTVPAPDTPLKILEEDPAEPTDGIKRRRMPESGDGEFFAAEANSVKSAPTSARRVTVEQVEVVFRWFRPDGKLEQQIPVTVTGEVNAKVKTSSWLKLFRATDAALLGAVDPSFGFEEFIGTWQVRLVFGTRPVAETKFNVLC